MRNYIANVFIVSLCGLIFSNALFAQDTTATKNKLTLSGYAEVYYSYDFNNPVSNKKPAFLYNYANNNEVNLNLGFIKVSYADEKIRGNLSLAAGTYVNAAYAGEPGVLKSIFEADIGIKISNKQNIWVDAGIFPSHIGFESAIGTTCFSLTRSIVAENTPYYESGIKIGYTSKNNKWFLSGLFLNGWQHITRPQNNTTPAFGTQVTYTPSPLVTINYSTFIGNDKPDSIKQVRIYHNMYAIFQCNTQWGIITGLDYGMQQKAKGSGSYNSLYAPVLMVKFSPGNKSDFSVRGEYYVDADGIIVPTGTAHGFNIFGWSFNYDRHISSKLVWRTELRNLVGKDDYFTRHDNTGTNNSLFLTSSLAINL